MKRKGCAWLFILISAFLFTSTTSELSAEDNQAATVQVIQLVKDVSDALIKTDTAKVSELWTSDFTYIHSNGAQQSKSQFLDDVKTGRRKYFSITPGDMQTRFYGTTAVVTGVTDMKLGTGGRDLDLKLRFTAVCVQEGGKWLIASWQSTAMPVPKSADR